MATYVLPFFGEIKSPHLQEYYEVEIDFNSRKIELDLNFESEKIAVVELDKVKKILENIEKFDLQNQKYLLDDYYDEEGENAKFYLEHHLEEVEKELLATLINFEDVKNDPEKQLLSKLQLIRIGFYPDDEENFVVYDYSIGTEITNYILAIHTDDEGNLEYMSMES